MALRLLSLFLVLLSFSSPKLLADNLNASAPVSIEGYRLQELFGHMQLFVDESQSLDFTDVRKQASFSPLLSQSITAVRNPVWLRFQAHNPETHSIDAAISLPHTLRSPLTLYYPDENNQYQTSNILAPVGPLSIYGVTFQLPPGTHTLYLQIEFSLASVFLPEIGREQAYNKEHILWNNISLLNNGFLIAMLIYAFYIYRTLGWQDNQEAHYFFIYVVSTILLASYLNGHLNILPAKLLDFIFSPMIWLWKAMLIALTIRYFSLIKPHSIAFKIITGLVIVNGVQALGILYIDNLLWNSLFYLSSFMLRLLPAVLVGYYIYKDYQGGWTFYLAVLINIIATIYVTAGTLQLINQSPFMISGLSIANTLVVLLIGLALSKRLQFNHHTRQKLEQEAELAHVENEMKTNFLTTMSHEIRTPLNGMLGMLQLIQENKLDSDEKRKIRIILDSGNSLLNIINDILDFSKMESGKTHIKNEPFSVDTLVSSLTSFFGPSAVAKNSRLKLNYVKANMPLSLHGDLSRIRQVCNNLLGNAIKFTNNGTIEFIIDYQRIDEDNINLILSVKDTGIGINTDHLNDIFHPFTQADGSISRKYGGTGLGLSISKKLAISLGGDLVVQSKTGEGSLFTFNIPCKIDHQTENKRLEIIQAIKGKSLQIVMKKKDVQQALQFFYNHNGMEVTVHPTLIELIESRQKSDCIITDTEEMLSFKDSQIEELSFLADKILIVAGTDQNNIYIDEKHSNMSIFYSPFTAYDMIEYFISEQDGQDINKLNNLQNSSTNSQSYRPSILCAEDNIVNKQVLEGMLKKLNIEADFTDNGLAAFHQYQNKPYDLIFMDCEMPEMDGRTATKKIREWEQSHQLPAAKIIALTAHAFAEAKQQCLDAGMDDLITKPVMMKELRKTIDNTTQELRKKTTA